MSSSSRRTTIEHGDGSELAAGLSKHWFSREDTTSFAVVGSTLATGTWPDGTSGLDERQLAGFDLDSGEELWRTHLQDDVSPNIVEPVTDGPVRLFDTAGFRLFDLVVNTGKATQVATLTNPFDFPDQFEVDFHPFAIGNMLVLCRSLRSTRSTQSPTVSPADTPVSQLTRERLSPSSWSAMPSQRPGSRPHTGP